MRPVLTEAGQKKIEKTLSELGFTELAMMESVAWNVANSVSKFLKTHSSTRHLCFLIGPGNNGGDGLAVLRCLKNSNSLKKLDSCLIAYWSELKSETAKVQNSLLEWMDGSIDGSIVVSIERLPLSQLPERIEKLQGDFLIIDALFGVGYRARESVQNPSFSWVQKLVDKGRARVVAIDLPSGLCADGYCDERFADLKADRSYCIVGPKVAQLEPKALERSGQLRFVDLGISGSSSRLLSKLSSDDFSFLWIEKSRSELFRYFKEKKIRFRKLKRGAHKNERGRVLIVGGSLKRGGATQLVADAALRLGAGLVTLVENERASMVSEFSNPFPEALLQSRPQSEAQWTELFHSHQVLVFGPGLPAGGLEKDHPEWILFQRALLSELQNSKSPLKAVVVDGGGLSTLARWMHENFQIPVVWTPHPKEALEICGARHNDLSATVTERLKLFASLEKAVKGFAGAFLLKGGYPLYKDFSQGGAGFAFDVASPKLATAGSGDVLSGAIAGLFLSLESVNKEESSSAAKLSAATFLAQFLQMRSVEKLSTSVLASEISLALSEEFDSLFQQSS